MGFKSESEKKGYYGIDYYLLGVDFSVGAVVVGSGLTQEEVGLPIGVGHYGEMVYPCLDGPLRSREKWQQFSIASK